MPRTDDKRIVTREDMLSALGRYNWREMMTRPTIIHAVVAGVWGVEHVYDAKTAAQYIKKPAFDALLAEMVEDGSVVKMTGDEVYDLDKGLRTTSNWAYYMLPARAESLRKAAADRQEEVLQKEDEEHAWRVLAERYPEEFAAIVRARREERSAAVVEEPGRPG